MPAKKNRKRNAVPSSHSQAWRRRPQVESLETRLLLASDWTNPVDVYNVDGSDSAAESIAPIDALLVINELSNPKVSDPATGLLPELTADDLDPSVYYDVNGDGVVSPIDALLVVNQLNLAAQNSDIGQATFASANVIVGSRAALAGGISDDTLVNTTTSRVQKFPDVASTSLGDSVVVWQSFAQDGRGWGIYGQRFDPTGAAVGSEFQVNTTTKGGQTAPAVAMSEDGGFVVVWHSVVGADGSGFGVYGQQFDSSGNPVGDELLINTTTTGKQCHADVAFSGDDFTVVWQGRGEGDVNGIYARTFSGGVGGAEMLVNTYTKGFQGAPIVDGNANGNTVVAWEGKGEGDVYGVFMRDIGTGGDQVMVNVEAKLTQRIPAIAVDDGGGIVVAWHNPPKGIWARSFAADGTGSSVIQVNETDPGVQTHPDIAFVNGGFAVVWHGKGEGDNRGTFVRTFGSDGAASSDETLVNQTSKAAQVQPSIAAANEGYIVAWQGRGAGDKFGTFARFFETDIAGPFVLNAISDGSVDEGSTFTTTASITDSDGSGDDVPTFSLTTAPDGAAIDATTGVVNWATVEADGPGTFQFTVVASQGEFSSSDTFMVTVNEVNLAPQLTQISDVTALLDDAFGFTVAATDADVPAQTLTYSATGTPSWLSFDPATQTFSGTPTTGDEGASTIEVTVSDGNGGTDSQTFVVTATGNQAPVVATEIPNASVTEAAAANIGVAGNFTDPEGDTITFSSTNLPAWASLNSSTGVITGTPGNSDVGVTNVTITATDSFNGAVSDTFQLTVVDVNTMDPSVLEGSFRVAASASNGTTVGTVFAQDFDPSDVLTYSITTGNAAGAFAIDASTGEISVADSTALAALPTSNALTVGVSDGTNTVSAPVTVVVSNEAALVAYSLQVVDPSNGAVLSTVTAGQTVHLVLNVQTVGTGSPGVFSAYSDIVFNPDAVSIATLDPSLCEPVGAAARINGNVCHSSTYINGQFADVSTAGLINEAGGTDGIAPLGDGVIEVLRVPMTIASLPAGTVVGFATNDADSDSIRATTIFNSNVEALPSQLAFSGASVTVSSPQATAAVVDAVFAESGDDEKDA